MGHAIVKQPNGKLAVYSTITGDFIMEDADADDIIAMYVADATLDILRRMRESMERVEKTGTSSRMGQDWDACVESIRELHGTRE
jgi:hypothetical protein